MKDHLNFNFLDLESVFTSFEGFTELSFQDRENRFDFVSLVIFALIEQLSKLSSIVSGDSFSFPVPDRDK